MSRIAQWLIGLGVAGGISITAVLAMLAVGGRPALERIVQGDHEPNLFLTLHAVSLAWLVFGVALALVGRRWMDGSRAFVFAGALCVSLLYINILREWPAYGDLNDYLLAAERLDAGLPLPPRYLYPPLWGTFLALLLPLGSEAVFHISWLLNIISLTLFYLLLQRTLLLYGFTSPTSAIVCLLFCMVNVPLLRTLGYGQINLHVMNLILATLLWYPRFRSGSALALSLAVNLKLSPLAVALPFALLPDRRWIAAFVGGAVAVAAMPIVLYGPGPYSDVIDNLRNVYTANRLAFRDNSIDSFFRAIAFITGRTAGWTAIFVAIAKAALALICLTVSIAHARRRTFVPHGMPSATVLNMAPALLVLMVMMSPLVWEHHPVYLAASYLAVLPRLHTQQQILWYAFAYYLEFIVPTFDAFPWSYGRLVSPVILLWLMWAVRTSALSPVFLRIEQVLSARNTQTVQ